MKFDSTTSWNFEHNLLILEMLKDIKKLIMGDNGEHLRKSSYGILMLQKELQLHNIESEVYVLESSGKPVSIILDCAGTLWSILGNDAIKRTLVFQWIEPEKENIQLIPLKKSSYFNDRYIQNLMGNLNVSNNKLYTQKNWDKETNYIIEDSKKIHLTPFIVQYPKDMFNKFEIDFMLIKKEKDIPILQKKEFEDSIKQIENKIKQMEDYEEIKEYTQSPWFALIKEQTQTLKNNHLNLIENQGEEGIEFIHFNSGREARKIKMALNNEYEQRQLIDVLASHLLFDAAKNYSYKNKEDKTIYFYDGWNPIIPLFFTDSIVCCNQKNKYSNILTIANHEPLKLTEYQEHLKILNDIEKQQQIEKKLRQKLSQKIQSNILKGPRF